MPHQHPSGRLTTWLARTLGRFSLSRAAAGLPSPLRGGDGSGGITHKSTLTGPYFAFDRLGSPAWAPRDYASFAREGFMGNAILYRSVRMIAEAAASVPLLLYQGEEEIAAAMHSPPEDTRAWTRARLLALAPPEAIVHVNWDSITFRGDSGKH